MSKRADSELIEIVTKFRNDYQPEAVQAAEIEIQKRNLSSEQLLKANDEIKIKELNLQARENEPLGARQKFMFFIFFWGVVPWGMAGTFKADGYKRKYEEAWKFMKYGFFGFIAFIALGFLYAYLTL